MRLLRTGEPPAAEAQALSKPRVVSGGYLELERDPHVLIGELRRLAGGEGGEEALAWTDEREVAKQDRLTVVSSCAIGGVTPLRRGRARSAPARRGR